MAIIFESPNGVWYKKKSDDELKQETLVKNAILHSQLDHTLDGISGSKELKTQLKNLSTEIEFVKKDISTNSTEIGFLKTANQRIANLENKLFYHAWFFKKGSYDYLEFDSFEDDSKLYYGKIEDGRLVPEKSNDYSIYRTVKFIPKLKKSISRYMMHVEYHIENNGGLIVEISFDNGQKYHTVLSTVQDQNVYYYYQYPDFCDCDNNVPEQDADSFIIRFRLLANSSGNGVHVSSYGIMVS